MILSIPPGEVQVAVRHGHTVGHWRSKPRKPEHKRATNMTAETSADDHYSQVNAIWSRTVHLLIRKVDVTQTRLSRSDFDLAVEIFYRVMEAGGPCQSSFDRLFVWRPEHCMLGGLRRVCDDCLSDVLDPAPSEPSAFEAKLKARKSQEA